VECFGGWGKGELGEAQGEGGQHRRGGARTGKDRAGALCTGFTLVYRKVGLVVDNTPLSSLFLVCLRIYFLLE
jgi:hypothetical protein